MPTIMLSVNPPMCETSAVIDRRFQRALEAWLQSISSPNTRAAYGRDLEVYADWVERARLRPVDVTPSDIADFREHCVAAGSGPATVNRRLAAVSSFYRNARWSGGNPAATAERSVVPSDRPAVMSKASARRIWSAAAARGGTTSVIVGLMLLDGFKTKDVLALDVDDVKWSGRVASIAGVSLHAQTAAAIRAHVAQRRSGPLLTRDLSTEEPDRLTRFGVDYLVKRVGADAGQPVPLTVNALRAAHMAGHEPEWSARR
jgi:integrase/recombinase XerD